MARHPYADARAPAILPSPHESTKGAAVLYDYLHEFTVVARERSFSRAAYKLGISQPALGRHISALETHLGTKLVVRGPRGASLTLDGRYVLNKALDICSIAEAIDMHFHKGHGTRDARQVLVAGFSNSFTAQRALSDAAARPGHAGRPIELRYQMGYSLFSIAETLDASEADIGITMRSGLELEPLDAGLYRTQRLFAAGGAAVVEPGSQLENLAGPDGCIHLIDLANTPIGRMEGRQGNSDLQWRELVRNCATLGFVPTSWTVGFDFVPGWGDWHLPNCATVFLRGHPRFRSPQTRRQGGPAHRGPLLRVLWHRAGQRQGSH